MNQRVSLIYLHVVPLVLHEIASAAQPLTPRFWDLVYEHQLEMLSPETSEAVLRFIWLCSEGDVMWENQVKWHDAKKFRGPYPPGCVLCLDADGAAAVLKCFEREPMNRENVLSIWSCGGDADWRWKSDLEDFVWRVYQDLEALVRSAVIDGESVLAALSFGEPDVRTLE